MIKNIHTLTSAPTFAGISCASGRRALRSTLVLALVFSGCTATYGPMKANSGYSEKHIDENTIQVTYKGNVRHGKEDVRTRLIYRCSEVTVENGYPYFIVIADSSYKHVGKKEFGESDLSFETTTTMSGGVNTRVRSTFGAQETDTYFVGVFNIRLLRNPVTHAVDAKAYIRDNNRN